MFKKWLEGLDPIASLPVPQPAIQTAPVQSVPNPDPVQPPMDLEPPVELKAPEDPGLDMPEYGKSAPPAGNGETDEGVTIGNMGAKIVGTITDWSRPEGGFLVRVKNPEVLKAGIELLSKEIQVFNQFAGRLIARSTSETSALREIQSPWFFTAGLRIQALSDPGRDERERNLLQLQLLSPKLEKKWNSFVQGNNLGIRVTNPEVMPEPAGSIEAEPEGTPAPMPV